MLVPRDPFGRVPFYVKIVKLVAVRPIGLAAGDIIQVESIEADNRGVGVRHNGAYLSLHPSEFEVIRWRCPTDTNGDGDCHLCTRGGDRCPHKPS